MTELAIAPGQPAHSDRLSYRTYTITNLPELERAHDQGHLRDWDALMSADPGSTFFQGPAWCMAWYRSHSDTFQPLIVVVTCDDRLVGMVPLAVETAAQRLTFASDGMADYRDVVATPGFREVVIAELLRICGGGHFANELQIGPLQPDSETLSVLPGCAARPPRVRLIVRCHSTWRWWFRDPEAVRRLTSKESVRRHLSYYKRQGPVVLQRIDTNAAWDAVKHHFFEQHSLRQIYTERPLCFTDARNRAFYDALFRGSPSQIHVTILRAGDRVLAMHYGYTWKNVLYWGAPAFDIREERHSPGQILLALLLQSAQASGLRRLDLTIGLEDFKKRFSNDHAQLATVQVYARARRYYARRLRDGVVRVAKTRLPGLLRRLARERIRPSFLLSTRAAKRFGRMCAGTVHLRSHHKPNPSDKAPLIFVTEVSPATPRRTLPVDPHYLFRDNMLADLLKSHDGDRTTAARVAATVQEAPDLILAGHTLHTMLATDELVAWGWSCVGSRPVPVSGSDTRLEIEPNSSSLYGIYVVPGLRAGKALSAFLEGFLNERLGQSSERTYIVYPANDPPSRTIIEQHGFRLATPSA